MVVDTSLRDGREDKDTDGPVTEEDQKKEMLPSE